MRDVNVVDQCQVEYIAQIMPHKCWHHLFFILDSLLGNSYVLYKAHWMGRHDKGCHKVQPMSRVAFYYKIVKRLSNPAFQLR